MENVRPLDWDSAFFGFPVVEIRAPCLDAGQLRNVLHDLRARGVQLAYWPASPDSRLGETEAANLGGRLVDEKTTWTIDLQTAAPPGLDGPRVEEWDASMPLADLHALAIQAGEFSRFAADPQIPRDKFQKLYMTWVEKSVSGEMADAVLVIRNPEGRIAAMTTVGRKAGRGDIGLVAVGSDWRGRGFGGHLIRHAQQRHIRDGFRDAQVVTQASNIPACRLYAKCGYTVESTLPYYHFWL